MRPALLALAAAALLPARGAAQPDLPLLARAEAGGFVARDGASAAGVSLRATGGWRRLRVEGSIDWGGYVDGGPRDYDFLLLAGAGASLPLSPRWSAFALAVGGLRALGTDEPGGGRGYHAHALPALGARVGATAERPFAWSALFGALTLAATVTADLRRERDFFLAEDVGGVTALASATVGFGFRR